MLLDALAQLRTRIGTTHSHGEKARMLAGCLRACEDAQRPLATLYLAGRVRQPDLTIAADQLHALEHASAAGDAALDLQAVDTVLAHVARVQGAGATARRSQLLRNLFERATRAEQTFLTQLILGQLASEAADELMLEAIAHGAALRFEPVRRAYMLSGNLAQVAQSAFDEGEAGLDSFDLRLFQPARPMLAQAAADIAEALTELGRAAFEYKLDGARVQLHKRGAEVRVYADNRADVTALLPEVVELGQTLPQRELILDGIVLASRPGGSPLPYPETMRRFTAKADVGALREALPLSVFFFDCLYMDGESLVEAPAEQRFHGLVRAVPSHARVPRIVTDSGDQASRFLGKALDAGHPGVIAKALGGAYLAGRRDRCWLGIKPAHTLDLVILAAEWGHGQQTGMLSNLHLGARDPQTGGFVMLGKTFKGLSEDVLRRQTAELVARETSRNAYTVFVRPELVVETAFSEIQPSPHSPAGLSLRLARIKRHLPDKSAADVDTLDRVRAIHEQTRRRQLRNEPARPVAGR